MSFTSRTILLVEDNADDVDLTLRAFRHAGITSPVQVVWDGEEALDYLLARGAYADRAGQALPAVVLLDLNLPQMDGHAVLRRIRAEPRTRLLPVVVLTSSGEEGDLERSQGEGANGYVRKPVGYMEFVEVVRQLGLHWLEPHLSPPAGGPP